MAQPDESLGHAQSLTVVAFVRLYLLLTGRGIVSLDPDSPENHYEKHYSCKPIHGSSIRGVSSSLQGELLHRAQFRLREIEFLPSLELSPVCEAQVFGR